jgi:hypothetical protein
MAELRQNDEIFCQGCVAIQPEKNGAGRNAMKLPLHSSHFNIFFVPHYLSVNLRQVALVKRQRYSRSTSNL